MPKRRYCDELLELTRQHASETWEQHFASCLSGAALLGTGDDPTAQQLLLEGYHGLLKTLEQIPPISREGLRSFAARQLVALHEATGHEPPRETAPETFR